MNFNGAELDDENDVYDDNDSDDKYGGTKIATGFTPPPNPPNQPKQPTTFI